MLSRITWTNYFIVVSSILTIYYIALFFRYYYNPWRLRMKEKNNGKSFASDHKNEAVKEPAADNNWERFQPSVDDEQSAGSFFRATDDDAIFADAHALSEKIKAAVTNAAFHNNDEQLLLSSIRSLIAAYPAVKAPAFKTAIQNLMETEIRKTFPDLSAEMIGSVWQ